MKKDREQGFFSLRVIDKSRPSLPQREITFPASFHIAVAGPILEFAPCSTLQPGPPATYKRAVFCRGTGYLGRMEADGRSRLPCYAVLPCLVTLYRRLG